jgi:multidrug resistance protein
MRRVFISLFIAVSVAMMGVGIIAPILPLYAETFSAKGVSIGLVFAAFSLSRTSLGPFLGRLSDRIGRKRMLLAGLLGYTVVSALYAIAANLWQLGMFRLLQGAASAMVTPVAQAYIGDITPHGKEGRYMNVFYSAMFFGMALGPLVGGGLSEAFSYRTAFYAMGGLSLLASILVAITVPTDHVRPHARVEKKSILPLSKVIKNDGVKAICVYVATRGFWRQGFNTFFPLFAATNTELGEASIGLVLSVYLIGGGLLQIPFGFLADRFPRFPQIILGSTIPPLLLIAVPFMSRIETILVVMFVIGALSALSRASILALRTELGRTHGMGTLAGLQGSAFAAGQMVGPPASGLVSDSLGVSAVFPFGAAIGLLGSGFVLVSLRRWRHAGFEGIGAGLDSRSM